MTPETDAMISLVLRDNYSAISVCVVNVGIYDNYMLINSYFLFLLLAFFYDNIIAIRCIVVLIVSEHNSR